MNPLMKIVENESSKRRALFPAFAPGDTLKVHLKIKEGEKERIQVFEGVVMQIRNRNTNGETFTIRKISNGIAVERILPIISPSIEKIEMLRKGKVRRARLFYLRGKIGKAGRIKEKRVGSSK